MKRPRDMTEISDALERAHSAAGAEILEMTLTGRNMEAEKEAVNTIGDFICNCYEHLDDLYKPPSGVEDADLDRLRAMGIDHVTHNALITTLMLAQQQLEGTRRAGAPDPGLGYAIGATAVFWEDTGAQICDKVTVVELVDDTPGPN